MDGDQVTALLTEFAARGLRVWVAGGWAVDATVGRQTRPHGDLDLAVDAAPLGEQLPHPPRLRHLDLSGLRRPTHRHLHPSIPPHHPCRS